MKHYYIIVDKDLVALANEKVKGSIFSTPLSSIGQNPATHYICGSHLEDSQLQDIISIGDSPLVRYYDSSSYNIDSLLDYLNLKIINPEL